MYPCRRRYGAGLGKDRLRPIRGKADIGSRVAALFLVKKDVPGAS